MKKERKSGGLYLFWYTHPRAAIALLLVAINLVVILFFTALLSIISKNPFFEELSYLFTYTMCSDGIYDFVNQQEDVTCFVIKIVLTVVQMVIFSGALIGFTTDILQSTINKRVENVGKLKLRDHYVFLNWSAIGPNIIYDLSFQEEKKTIVILCEKNRHEVMTSIENIFTENQRSIRNMELFIKYGTPNSSKHLKDVSIDNAKYIGVLLSDESVTEDDGILISDADLSSFKVLMAIRNMGSRANIAVEVENESTEKRIEHFLHKTDPSLLNRVSVFAHNSVIGHILGRAVINPLYSQLFHHILSYKGCEFYSLPTMDLEQALYRYHNCIPIINYDDDCEIDENGETAADQLYFLADDFESIEERKTPHSFAKPIPYRERIIRENFTLIILSDSDRVRFVSEELDAYNRLFGKSITVEVHSYSENIDIFAEHIRAIPGNKKILLLSSERGNQADQDADVFIALISLKISGKLDPHIPIYAEIVNPKNLISMQNLGVASVIVSSKIISLFMAQLLTHPGSRRFYRDIILTNGIGDAGSIDFDIIRAEDLLEFNAQEMTFSSKSELIQSFFLASGKKKMCVGIKPEGSDCQEISFLSSETDTAAPVTLHPKDELILITS